MGEVNAKAERKFSYCLVCRLNHEQGRGHRYSKSHRNALKNVLAKAHTKIQSIRVFLDNPQADAPPPPRFWCTFCEQDVAYHSDNSFPCSGAICHFASSKHIANVKKFWCEHGADVKIRQEFIISKEDVKKWEAACKEAKDARDNNIHNHDLLSAGNSIDIPNLSVVIPLPILKDQIMQVSSQNGALLQHRQPVRQTLSSSGPNLTIIRPPPLLPGEGNVHTEAPPPWLCGLSNVNEETHYVEMSKTKERKLKKLDKRVGAAWANKRRAELARESNSSWSQASTANWLPSFGRVWQSGSRRDTRKEFEAESSQSRKPEFVPVITTEQPVQPYIGKRKRAG